MLNNNICKNLRELLSFFIFNPESLEISIKENEFGNPTVTIHLLSKDMDKIIGQKRKIFDSIIKIVRASLKNENAEVVLDVFGN